MKRLRLMALLLCSCLILSGCGMKNADPTAETIPETITETITETIPETTIVSSANCIFSGKIPENDVTWDELVDMSYQCDLSTSIERELTIIIQSIDLPLFSANPQSTIESTADLADLTPENGQFSDYGKWLSWTSACYEQAHGKPFFWTITGEILPGDEESSLVYTYIAMDPDALISVATSFVFSTEFVECTPDEETLLNNWLNPLPKF